MYWINKDGAMALVRKLLEDEAALTLSGAEALLTLSGASAIPEERRREVASAMEDASSRDLCWAFCELCGRARETTHWLPVWWRYCCGDLESKNRDLTCQDLGDFLPPRCPAAPPS